MRLLNHYTERVIFIDDSKGANAIRPVLEGITSETATHSANGASETGGVPLRLADTCRKKETERSSHEAVTDDSRH